MEKVMCTKCKKTKSTDEFYKDKSKPKRSNCMNHCKACLNKGKAVKIKEQQEQATTKQQKANKAAIKEYDKKEAASKKQRQQLKKRHKEESMTAKTKIRSIEDLIVYPFPCPNCGKTLNSKKIFCSDLCRDEAKFVRYFRACISDGRDELEDVKEALRIRLAHILRGGYREKLRQLSKEVRENVIKRDKGLCRKCGAKGIQIDHIEGDSNNIKNLQLICIRCHIEKTLGNLVPISPETHPKEWNKRTELLSRATSSQPLQFCDSPAWKKQWAAVKRGRNKILKTI